VDMRPSITHWGTLVRWGPVPPLNLSDGGPQEEYKGENRRRGQSGP